MSCLATVLECVGRSAVSHWLRGHYKPQARDSITHARGLQSEAPSGCTSMGIPKELYKERGKPLDTCLTHGTPLLDDNFRKLDSSCPSPLPTGVPSLRPPHPGGPGGSLEGGGEITRAISLQWASQPGTGGCWQEKVSNKMRL